MPGSTITSTTLSKPKPLSFVPKNPAGDQKKVNSRASADFITIIAHGLEKFENINTALDQLAQGIFEPSDSGKRKLFGLPSVYYSFDIVRLIEDGEGWFHKEYLQFRKHVRQALVSVPTTCSVTLKFCEDVPEKFNEANLECLKTENSRKSTSLVSRPPRIIFLAHGIASWLVKRLLAEAGGRIRVPDDDKFLNIEQVESIIFLQDFPRSQTLDVSYTNYVEQWVNVLSEFSLLEDDCLEHLDDVEDEQMGDRETDGGKRLFVLKQRLRWIDDRFGELSGNRQLSSHTWVLDPHSPIIDMRKTSHLPGSQYVSFDKHTGAVNHLLRRRRNSTATARGGTVNIDVHRIGAFLQITSPEDDKGSHSDQNFALKRVVVVSKKKIEFESCLYFRQSHGKPANLRNRPQATHHRSSSEPQGVVTGLDFSEHTATEASRSFQRPYSFPASNPRPLVGKLSNDGKWLIIFDRARKYLSQCDLDNADVLCKWCVDTGDELFKGTDIPLQWRMRRAVIQILRGQYRDAHTQLRNILMICFGLLEGPGAANKAWRIPETAGDAEYLPQFPWSTRRPSEVSGIASTGPQDFEMEQDTRKHLFILSLELSYNIALVLTQMGKFHEAENRVKGLRNHFLQQWGTSCFSGKEMALEETRQCKVLVDANMLLALLKGYQGSFSEATSLMAEADGAEKNVQEAEGTNHGTQSLRSLTYAKILSSCGRIQDALDLVQKKLPEMEKCLGRFHLTTLETRCLNALLLSNASKALAAEALCSETNDLIKRHLGEHHPLVLDIISVLVSVCEIQARPLQALRISENLCTRAEETLGARDQRTIRFQGQQAWIHVWIGNYEKGELLLQETYNASKLLWGPTHPWTLEYIPKLAFTYYLRGKASLSNEYFSDALRKQMVACRIATDEDAVLNKPLHHLVQEVLSAIRSFNTTADAQPIVSQHMHSGSDHGYQLSSSSPRSVHPDIILTLELWAEAESREATRHQDLLLETLRIIYDTRNTSRSFGKLHVFTLRAGLNLAKTMTESSGTDMALVEELYGVLCHNAEEALDSEHPLTLSARQGLQTVQLVRETSALKSPNSIADFFASDQKAITFRLGNNHPDVFRFSLNTFTLLMMVDIERAGKIAQVFLEHVRTKAVWDQRAVESIRLQEQLAWAYFTQKKAAAALEILQHLTTQLVGFGLKPNDPLYELGIKIRQAETIVRMETEGFSTEDVREE